MRSSPFFKMALLLGLLSAIGPFAIDMYLPALPAIGQSLRADIGAVQMSLTAFFLSLGAGQLLYGPISDMVGRKPPLYAGLVLFALASVGCALATDIQTLIALRFIQGLGAAAGMAIPRAVVRDLHTGTDAARLMSLLMLVFSVSPILAPLAGSAVIVKLLDETRPASERVESSLGSALSAYWLLLRDRHYLGLVFIGSFAMAGFFTYLANSSFVMIDHYGLSPALYSVAFGVNAAAFIGASQFTGSLGERYGLVNLVKFGVVCCGAAMVAMFVYFAMGGDNIWVLIVLYFIASGFMGLVIPTTGVLALEMHGAIAGTASALLGTLQMLTGALAMAVVGLFTDGRPLPMVAGMAGGALIALLLTWLTLGSVRSEPTQRTQQA
jgi:DHA1 family bicyclomycin/chloramphenicol resistance-like MFS transporter